MKTAMTALMCAGLLGSAASAADPSKDSDRFWPQWRGPRASGFAPHGDPPVEWSETTNLRWKAALPGKGNATPIVWGDRVYVQTAVETDRRIEPETPATPEPAEQQDSRRRPAWGGGPKPAHVHQFVVLAFDRRTGEVVWQTTVCEAVPHEGGHQDATQASNSPVTDGEHFFAYFGSRGLYAYDMQGQLFWQKDLGDMQTRNSFGEGSSPALYGDTLVVNWDHEGDDFIVALDKRTGRELWRAARDEPTSWSTPLIVEHDGQAQVVTSATNRVRAYALETGELLWECGGMTGNVIPSPVASGNGLVYAISGFRGSALLAIRYAGAQGNVSDSLAVAWSYDGKGTPYVPSPLLYAETLLFLDTNREIISCVDAATGAAHYARQRLDGVKGVYASPVGAAGRVYVVGRNGTTAVIKHGREFELLATNTLDDGFDASPAIAGRELYLRGRKNLYCIAPD